jgi:hypothetical protein
MGRTRPIACMRSPRRWLAVAVGARDAAKEAPQAGAGARLCLDRRPVRRLLPSRPRRPPRSRPIHGVGDRGARGHPLISAASTAPPIEDGAGAAAAEDEALKNDAYTATTYGDLEKMQRLVEGEGRSVGEPDSGGTTHSSGPCSTTVSPPCSTSSRLPSATALLSASQLLPRHPPRRRYVLPPLSKCDLNPFPSSPNRIAELPK